LQVEEKRKIKEFEKSMNDEQGRIWKTDSKAYFEQERISEGKVIYFLN
jgi:hypothetical protein